MKAYRIKIFGKVQGVWYRVSAKNKAEELGVKGYVQNQKDGSVKVVVEGEKEQVKKFISWCKEGPENARIEEVDIKKIEAEAFKDFDIVR